VRTARLTIDPAFGVIESIARHPRMLSAEDLADALAMSPKTIYAQARSGKLPAVRIGQSVRFAPQERGGLAIGQGCLRQFENCDGL
jgi:excisionase family DNA binding protein